jgi:hypothetical protein
MFAGDFTHSEDIALERHLKTLPFLGSMWPRLLSRSASKICSAARNPIFPELTHRAVLLQQQGFARGRFRADTIVELTTLRPAKTILTGLA